MSRGGGGQCPEPGLLTRIELMSDNDRLKPLRSRTCLCGVSQRQRTIPQQLTELCMQFLRSEGSRTGFGLSEKGARS